MPLPWLPLAGQKAFHGLDHITLPAPPLLHPLLNVAHDVGQNVPDMLGLGCRQLAFELATPTKEEQTFEVMFFAGLQWPPQFPFGFPLELFKLWVYVTHCWILSAGQRHAR